jgi:hypothetical protein
MMDDGSRGGMNIQQHNTARIEQSGTEAGVLSFEFWLQERAGATGPQGGKQQQPTNAVSVAPRASPQ